MKLLSVNHYWRIAASGLCYIMFGLGAFIPVIYMLCLTKLPINANEKQIKARNVIKRLCLFYINFMQFVGLMDYRVNTFGHNLNKPFVAHLVIANHSTLIDALFVLAYVDNVCCVVKHQLTVNPFTKFIVLLAGYISNGSDDPITEATKKLAKGENVLIFPEGTRNTFDTELNFKRGAANIAVISECPVLPLIILPQPRALERGVKWYKIPDKKSIVHFHIKPTLHLSDCVNTKLPRTIQYRRLTEFWRNYYLKEISQID